MRDILFVATIIVAAFTYASGQAREPPLENERIEDLKGVTKIYVAAPDHYSSLFLRKIVETVRKEIPGLVFIWSTFSALTLHSLPYTPMSSVGTARPRPTCVSTTSASTKMTSN